MTEHSFAELSLIDAMQVTLVMLAQCRGALSKPAAVNALGVTPQQYDRFRLDAVHAGQHVAGKLRAGRAA